MRFRDGRLICIDLQLDPHDPDKFAVFGLLVAGGLVVDAAPIAGWAIGRDETYVAGYYRGRGAQITPL